MDTEKLAKDRADWLLDAVAMSIQDRRFLRGDPEYDKVAGEAILLNGEKAIRVALEKQAEMIGRLRAALQPFADCCEYIKKSEDDDEWAKFRLVIKNYRDAREALK